MDSIGGTIDFEIHCFQRTRDRADDPLLVIDDQYTPHNGLLSGRETEGGFHPFGKPVNDLGAPVQPRDRSMTWLSSAPRASTSPS